MKILIHLQSATPLLCHEALSLAFALATFEHEIQLWLDTKSVATFLTSSTLVKMLGSLALYDIPPVWVSATDYHALQHHTQQPVDFLANITQLPTNDITPSFALTLTL